MANFFNLLLLLLGSWLGLQGAVEQAFAVAPVIMLLMLAIHIAFVKQRVGEISIIIIAGIIGAIVESINVIAGMYQYNTVETQTALLPTWIILIWFVLGAGVRHSLKWFAKQWYFAALLGAILGPSLYFVASYLGAIHVDSESAIVYILPCLLWALALPTIALANKAILNSYN